MSVQAKAKPTQPQTRAQAYPQPANLRWNFRMGIGNGIFFSAHDALINPNIVLVAFLAQLTDNALILGLTASLWFGGLSIPQFWISSRMQGMPRSLPVYRVMSLIRSVLWLVLITVTFAIDTPDILIVTMLAFIVVYPITWGVGAIAFQDIVGKTIPPRRRGEFFAWRLTLGGLVALLAADYVDRILSPELAFGFADNFAMLFAMAAAVTIIGMLFFHAVREPETHREPVRSGPRDLWQLGRRIWASDAQYRRYVMARIVLKIVVGVAPLAIAFAKLHFGLPLAAVSTLIIVDTVVRLFTVALSGWFSSRWGDRVLTRISILLGMAAFGLLVMGGFITLPTGAVLPYFAVIIGLLAACSGAMAIGLFALNLNVAPPEQLPLYVGLSNSLTGVMLYLSSAQGVVAAQFGYPALFALALLLAGIGWLLFNRIQDPSLGQAQEP